MKSNSPNPTYDEYTEQVFEESARVRQALTEAFLSEGVKFSLVRYIGLVNGCQQFLSDVTASLCDLTPREFKDLQIAAIKIFADASGIQTHIVDNSQQGEKL